MRKEWLFGRGIGIVDTESDMYGQSSPLPSPAVEMPPLPLSGVVNAVRSCDMRARDHPGHFSYSLLLHERHRSNFPVQFTAVARSAVWRPTAVPTSLLNFPFCEQVRFLGSDEGAATAAPREADPAWWVRCSANLCGCGAVSTQSAGAGARAERRCFAVPANSE